MDEQNPQKPQKDHALRNAFLQLLLALFGLALAFAPIVLLLWCFF